MFYTCKYASPLGLLTLASDGENLCGIWFDGQAFFGHGASGPWEEKEVPVLAQTRRWLDAYFAGQKPKSPPPMKPEGTPFRKAVWEILLTIPYGQTVTYGQIARQLGVASAQAVGGAVGHNPISILIPCHRVVGANGSLTGYAGGTQRKQALLELENALRENMEKGIDFLLPGRYDKEAVSTC